jgi:septum site-determining protein MinC
MSKAKHNVTIKGAKDGFHFILNETCPFEELVKEMKYKLATSHHKILTGPIVHVHIKLGKRQLSEEQKQEIRDLMKEKGNLILKSIDSDSHATPIHTPSSKNIDIIHTIIRSGQVLTHQGNLLLMGDVNPGGTVRSTGDIYIMGMLRGTAHAGLDGDEQAIISASYMRPTQLRIAQVISRPPDEWESDDHRMEFAYLQKDQMSIEKISQLHRIRPDTGR